MLRKTFLATLCASAALALSTPASAAPVQQFKAEDGTVEVTTVTRGLERPWSVAFLPDQQGMLVTERSGNLRRVSPDGKLLASTGKDGSIHIWDATPLASIDPEADACYDPRRVPFDLRWQLQTPELDAVRQFMVATLETTLELLEHAGNDDDALYFYRLALFHEDRRGEMLATLSQSLGLAAPWLPAQSATARRDPLVFPAGTWILGSGPEGFAFDNERPVQREPFPEFEIDAQAVTWDQYAEFVEDGGYDESRWWSEDGWQWVQGQGKQI